MNFRLVRALADRKLVFVHDAIVGIKIRIRVCHLWNESQRNTGGNTGFIIRFAPVFGHDPMADGGAPLWFEIQRRKRRKSQMALG